jgi:hypothetical protein
MRETIPDDRTRGDVMWRLSAVIVLFVGAGCASDGQSHWYDEALKDLRGDNMEMHGFKSPRDTNSTSSAGSQAP